MLSRLDFTAVVRGHWRGLRNRAATTSTPDLPARWVLVVTPTLLAAFVWWHPVHLRDPGVLVGGLSLLSAGLLAAFAQIANIRSGYRVPDDPSYDFDAATRDMLDEAVAHTLAAALLAAATVVIVIIGMNLGTYTPHSHVTAPVQLNTGFSAVVTWAGTYLALLFIMTVRKLYGAYVVANEVSHDLSGHR